LVGSLDDRAAIWQSKFFTAGIDNTQKREIRESFAQAIRKGREEGYEVEYWTLCVPIQMSPQEGKWWDQWRRRMEKEHAGLTIQLWDRDKISSLLYSPEGKPVRVQFLNEPEEAPLRDVVELPANRDFDEMLFVKQLRAAGLIELTAPKREFFNAEVLARDVQEKGVPSEVAELIAERVDVHSVWSAAFNGACATSAETSPALLGLYDGVMQQLRSSYAQRQPPPLGMRPVHRLGTMHQVVDDGEAGWRRDYLDIAKEHLVE
jgi:hypothetical protein